MQGNDNDADSDHHVDFASGNVKLITTKESWDLHLEQANKDSKIVSFTYLICGTMILTSI